MAPEVLGARRVLSVATSVYTAVAAALSDTLDCYNSNRGADQNNGNNWYERLVLSNDPGKNHADKETSDINH